MRNLHKPVGGTRPYSAAASVERQLARARSALAPPDAASPESQPDGFETRTGSHISREEIQTLIVVTIVLHTM
jgi:hypothetical protein